MCLITDNKTPFVAEEDIEVYKVMGMTTNWGGSPIGIPPYRPLYRYHPGKNQPSDYDIAMHGRKPMKTLWSGKNYIVRAGYLHAYVSPEPAYLLQNKLQFQNRSLGLRIETGHDAPIEVVKMTVPKGTEYFLGDSNDIAAETLVWTIEDKNV